MDYLLPLPPSFWSIRMYDGLTRYSVPNPINRYSLGSDNDLKKNADCSFTLFLQADSPGPDKESNWFLAPKGPILPFTPQLCTRARSRKRFARYCHLCGAASGGAGSLGVP